MPSPPLGSADPDEAGRNSTAPVNPEGLRLFGKGVSAGSAGGTNPSTREGRATEPPDETGGGTVREGADAPESGGSAGSATGVDGESRERRTTGSEDMRTTRPTADGCQG